MKKITHFQVKFFNLPPLKTPSPRGHHPPPSHPTHPHLEKFRVYNSPARYPVFEAVNNRGSFFRKSGFDQPPSQKSCIFVTPFIYRTSQNRYHGPNSGQHFLNLLYEKFASKQKVTRGIKIPKKYHGKIIGHAGNNVFKLKVTYNVDIAMPRLNDGSDLITIVGKKDQVDKLANLLQWHQYYFKAKETAMNGGYQTRRKRTFVHLLGIRVSCENHSKYVFFWVIFG